MYNDLVVGISQPLGEPTAEPGSDRGKAMRASKYKEQAERGNGCIQTTE